MAARLTDDMTSTAGPGAPPPDTGGQAAQTWGVSVEALDLAVSGTACRLPGANDPAAFWALLESGRCAISAVPEDRWSSAKFDRPQGAGGRGVPGRAYTRAAGVLDDLWGFDAGFFGISAREAAQMDPQQRLVLEVAWEAIEEAGFLGGGYRRDPADEGGPGRTGVYVGAATMDHAQRFAGDVAGIDSPFMTGNTLSVIANRVSHVFDFRGPSLVVDTACASSLTALHLAAGALARGEIDTALVVGVNVLLQPFNFVGFSAAAMLSPSGRCRPFAEGADGYVRGEGAIAIVLRRRADALSAGQPVQAVLAASGIGTDGHKAGLTRPSPDAQAALIGAVHAAAALPAAQLAFAEAHGTGTPTGDPIEAAALARALGARRAAAGLGALPIGSVKGNIGHLEPAAGLVGVLKAVLALRHRRLPPSLLAGPVSSDIAALETLEVAVDGRTLATAGAPPAACVSSFGFGGANAHVVLRAGDPVGRPIEVETTAPLPPLVLSAASEDALATLARRWRQRAGDRSQAQLLAPAIAAAERRRTRLAERAVLGAPNVPRLLRALDALSEGRADPLVTRLGASARGPQPACAIALVFCGNGAQWAGMGAAMLRDPPAARAFEGAAAAIARGGGPDLTRLMQDPDLETHLQDSVAAQALLWAQQVAAGAALSAALAPRGLAPRLVLGHSVGEVAAACTAGALTLEDGARLILRRARAVQPLRGAGAMAALLADARTAEGLIGALGLEQSVALAADNSPRSVTLSGDTAALDRLAGEARARRLALRRLSVPYPYHAPALDQVSEALRAAGEGLRPRRGRLALISTVTGGLAEAGTLDADHWWANARAPVRFRAAIGAAVAAGAGVFVEIGPRPILGAYLRDCLKDLGADGLCLASEPGPGQEEEPGRLARIAATVAAASDQVTTPGADRAAVPADLPRYPWQRRPHRAALSTGATDLFGVDRPAGDKPVSPLLGHRDRVGCGPWLGSLDTDLIPWLAEHRVSGHALLPAAGFAALALEAAIETLRRRTAGDTPIPTVELTDLQIAAPCPIPDGAPGRLRTTVEEDAATVLIASATADGSSWREHARVGFCKHPGGADRPPHDDALAAAWAATTHETLYAALAAAGLEYGPCFRRLAALETSGNRARGTLRAAAGDDTAQALADADRFALHPAILDAAFHALQPLVARDAEGQTGLMVPTRLARLVLHRIPPPTAPLTVRARLVRRGEGSALADLALSTAGDGERVATLEGLTLERAATSATPAPERWVRHWIPLHHDPKIAPCDSAGTGATPTDPLASVARTLRAALGAERELDPGAVLLSEVARAAAAKDGGHATVCEPLDAVLPALLADDPSRGLEALRALAPPAEDGTPRFGAGAPGPRLEALRDGCMRAAGAVLGDLARHGLRILAIGLNVGRLRRLAAMADIGCIFAPNAPEVATIGEPPQPATLAPLLPDRAGADGLDLVLLAADGLPDEAAVEAMTGRLAPGGLLIAALPDPARDAPSAGTPARQTGSTPTVEIPLPDARLAARLLLAGPSHGPMFGAPVQERSILLLREGEPDAAIAALAASLGAPVRPLTRPGKLAEQIAVVVPGSATEESGASSASLARHLAFCRNLARRGAGSRPRQVIWLTRDAEGAGGAGPRDAGIAALRRVMANEVPSIRWSLLDGFAPGREAAVAPFLRAMSSAQAPEAEIRIDESGVARAPRLQRAARPCGGEPAVLTVQRRGDLSSLAWSPARPAPGTALPPGMVRLRVGAAALNFRDVMAALGRLPPRMLEGGFTGARLGMECAGTVIEAGEDADLTPGTAVFGFAAGALASEVVTDARLVAPMPEGLGPEAAAGLPAAYLTAIYALETLARLGPGERVLIHAATGGVGLAASAVARRLGARILATAGSPAKRRLAEALGAEAVLDSRDPAFADAVRAATGGAGVDVVLNSLAGPAQQRGIACLAPFGRFIELGKQDIAQNRSLSLAPFAENLAFLALDADRLLAAHPARVGALMRRLSADIAGEALPCLPVAAFEPEAASEAFALMQRGAHIGKIVIHAPGTAAARARSAVLPGSKTAWIVAGGTGGLGLELAAALARRRGAAVWLVARNAPSGPRAARLSALAAEGLALHLHRADAADPEALSALATRITARGYRLEGLLHAAMTLSDSPIEQQGPSLVDAVLRAKLAVAEALDGTAAAFADARLVMIGSAAALLGNPHQAAYAAANGALEGLARQRRAAGRHALTMILGPVGDAGRLAEDAVLRQQVETRLGRHLGGALLRTGAVAEAMLSAIDDPPADGVLTLVGAGTGRGGQPGLPRLAILDEPALSAIAPPPAAPPAKPGEPGPGSANDADTILARLRRCAAEVLRQPPGEIDPDRPLPEIGFDSLMLVDLKLTAESTLGRPLALEAMPEGTSLRALADRLATEANPNDASPPDPANATAAEDDGAVDTLLARHGAALTAEARTKVSDSMRRPAQADTPHAVTEPSHA